VHSRSAPTRIGPERPRNVTRVRFLEPYADAVAGRGLSKEEQNASHYFLLPGVVLLAFSAAASPNTFRFDTDPFAGTNVLNTPGRQLVGGEDFISFSIAQDVFSLESTVFGVGSTADFVNAPAANLPAAGVNVIVLESFDDDNNPQTPFGAGNAANLTANQITTPGPGSRYSPILMLLSCRQNRSQLERCSCGSRTALSPDLLPCCRGLMEALNLTVCSSSRPCGVAALGGR
jgi:hypothetical protein